LKRANFIFFRVILTVAAIMLSVSCGRITARRTLEAMTSEGIRLPDSLSCIRDGVKTPVPGGLDKKNRLVVFVDSSECTKCRISNFIRYGGAVELSENGCPFEVLFLLSIAPESYAEMVEYVQLSGLDFPVYIDETNAFRSLNPAVPDDSRYHSILIDDEGKVLFVGNPSAGETMWGLFQKAVSGLE